MTSPGLSTSVCGIIGSCSGSVYSLMSRSFCTIRPGSDRNVHCAGRGAELLQRVVVVGGDGGDLGVGHGDLRVVGGQLEVLLVLFRAVVAAGEDEDQGVVALELAELAGGAGVVGQRVVGEGAAGDDVGTHGLTPFMWRPVQSPAMVTCAGCST